MDEKMECLLETVRKLRQQRTLDVVMIRDKFMTLYAR